LEVDSTGGEPQAAEEIYQKIKLIEKPVIASIRADGTSSAYWAASSADYIFALNTSNIGSIGITMSYTDNAKKNEKEGITHNELNTGKYKGVGDENKALTGSDKSFILSFIGNIYETFIGDVASGRSLDVDVIRELADGRFWTGKQALELKLIDQIGTEDDVVDYIEELIGVDADICE
jgi:protease-4